LTIAFTPSFTTSKLALGSNSISDGALLTFVFIAPYSFSRCFLLLHSDGVLLFALSALSALWAGSLGSWVSLVRCIRYHGTLSLHYGANWKAGRAGWLMEFNSIGYPNYILDSRRLWETQTTFEVPCLFLPLVGGRRGRRFETKINTWYHSKSSPVLILSSMW
jgi:hypothetical protein